MDLVFTQAQKTFIMKKIERNPDINMDIEETPDGFYVHEGLNLMLTARSAKIPFGLAGRREIGTNRSRLDTVGVVIRNEDRARFEAALAKKEEAKSRKMAKC